jgi:hypothetical protein
MKNVPWSILAACRLSNLATVGFSKELASRKNGFFTPLITASFACNVFSVVQHCDRGSGCTHLFGVGNQ